MRSPCLALTDRVWINPVGCSRDCAAGWAGTAPCRRSRTRSNHPALGAGACGRPGIRRRTGMLWSAWSHPPGGRRPGTSACFATAAQSPFLLVLAVAGKPASVIAFAMTPGLVRSGSKRTVTVASRALIRLAVTPETLSSAFLIVMLHAGQVMFSTRRTTCFGVAAQATPIHAVRTKPKKILRTGNSYRNQPM